MALSTRLDNLGCHPENVALHCCGRGSVLIVRAFRDTEVGNLAYTSSFDQNSIGFEILSMIKSEHKENRRRRDDYRMKNTLRVKILKTFQDLCRE
jgi:hypothetical protein